MNDQGPSSSPSQEAGPSVPPSPSAAVRSGFPFKRIYPDTTIQELRKRRSCQPVGVPLKRHRQSVSIVPARLSTYQAPYLDHESSGGSIPGPSTSYQSDNTLGHVSPDSSRSEVVSPHFDSSCWSTPTCLASSSSATSESRSFPVALLASAPELSSDESAPSSRPLTDDCNQTATRPVYTERDRPDLVTTLRSEYSVTRERPRHLAEVIEKEMAPLDRLPLQQNRRRLPYSRPTIHQQFKLLSESENARQGRPDKENRDSQAPKRKRQDSDGFKVQRKGRFTQVAQRRKVNYLRRKSADGLSGHSQGGVPRASRFSLDAGTEVKNQQPVSVYDQRLLLEESATVFYPSMSSSVSDPAQHRSMPPDIHQYLKGRDNSDTDEEDIFYALVKPPINAKFLNAIDVVPYFKDAQTRHDLVTGKLVLMMDETDDISSLELAKLNLTIAGLGQPQTEEHVEKGRQIFLDFVESLEVYYHSLEVELRTGCRCVQYRRDADQKVRYEVYGLLPTAKTSKVCVCGRWMAGLDRDKWIEVTKLSPWPSRILPMLTELREMFKIIMPMGILPPPPVYETQEIPGYILPRCGQQGDRPSKQVVEKHPEAFHSVEQLLEAFDPITLADQIRNGTLDCTIFRKVAETLKFYCPEDVRNLADHMVEVADSGLFGKCARTCFDICRLMKLAQANTILETTYRPWLKETAIYHELASFERALDFEDAELEDYRPYEQYKLPREYHLQGSDTRGWIAGASTQVIADSPHDQFRHLTGDCSCGNRSELLIKSVVQGVFNIIMPHGDRVRNHWKFYSETRQRPNEQEWWSEMPESWRKDTNRLYYLALEVKSFAREASILHVVREFVRRYRPNYSSSDVDIVMNDCHLTVERYRNQDPEYYTKINAPPAPSSATPSEPVNTATAVNPSKFVISLVISILFPSSGEPLAVHPEPVKPMEIARELRAELEEVSDSGDEAYELELYADVMIRIKEVLVLKIHNELLRLRLEEFRPKFAPIHLDCQLATLALIESDDDVTPAKLEEGRFQFHRVVPSREPREISEDHIRRWAVAWKHHNEVLHEELPASLDIPSLSYMSKRMERFTEDMLEMIKGHLRVYWDIYAGKGMLDGSGECSVFERRQLRGLRKAANLANVVLTDTLPTPPVKEEVEDPAPAPTCDIQ